MSVDSKCEYLVSYIGAAKSEEGPLGEGNVSHCHEYGEDE